MQAIHLALKEFQDTHQGVPPTGIVITRRAVLAISAGQEPERVTGIPIQVVESFDLAGFQACAPGSGKQLGIFLNDNGVQVHVAAVDLDVKS